VSGCDPTCAAAGGKCSSNVCTIAENPGNVPAATQTKLQGSGTADTGFKWLYPYDKTVFPRGLLSPTLQFGGGASDGEYVHITSKTLDYKGYFAGGMAGSVTLSLSQKAWAAVAAAVGPGDSASVKVTKISGSSVAGPVSETWPIAQGNIRGTVFYETYGSTVAGGRNSVAILRINPGATSPTVFQGAMNGCGAICHSASADGSTIVSGTALTSSASWSVQSGTSITTAANTTFTYMGLYPDGAFGMTSTGFGVIYAASAQSRLFDTKTGATIAAPGWDSNITAAGTPSFSPDGKQIAFMREDVDVHTIAKADFSASTKTFSNITTLSSGASGYAAWPAFTPDGKVVLYQVGSDPTFETNCQNTGDVYAVDVATKMVRRLDILDGYSGSGTASYLPATDPGLNFAPTMLAEAVGGYFWTIFTSHRSYGSLLASKANSMGLGITNCVNPAGDEANGKLWLAAIDINAPAGTDPSHPAFYLDGQELQADNLRGYWVLPACKKLGVGCSSGDECCGGFCRGENGNTPVCVTKPTGCAMEFESCMTSSDCCTSSDVCINGRCAMPAAPM
jgi:WD40 repeat protein